MVSKKIDLVTWLTNWFQTTTNKVNSWSSTTSHTKYPSEKLVKDSLDAKADSTHSQTSATVTESSSLGRLGTSSNATQHDINVAINNLINTGGGSGEAALACVSDYYIDAQTNEIALTYCTGKVITNISKTTSGLVDTYTITYNDNTTYQFTVTNGADGSDATVDIVTNTNGWNSTTSDSKVPSEKLVKNSLDSKSDSTHSHNSHISYGRVDSTSTSTVFTATVNGVTELVDGTTVMLRNGYVTSASGFTLNVNNLGAKPVYNSMADATADTTIFNINYTMLFVYDSSRISGGCWICYRGYNSDNNTIGYQIRTNSSVFTASDRGYRYRLWLQCADGKLMPVNTSTSTNATAKRDSAMNTRKFVLGGKIIYNSTKADYSVDATLPATTLWQQYNFTFGYSFNNTGSALTLTPNTPIYMVCTDEGDGLGKLASPYYTQTLPNAVDNKLYVYLGMVTTATTVELGLEHPIFEYRNGGIGLWSNNGHSHTTSQITDFPSTMTPSSHAHGNLQNDGSVGTSNNASKNVVTDSNGKITTEDKPTIPTKTSDLQNDSGFLTSHQSLANYVQKSSTTGLLKNDGSVDTTSYLSSLPSHNHTVSNITDFPSFKTINNESIVGTGNITISGGGSEAEFLTGSFSASSSYIIVANSSKSTIDDGDRFYVHITNTSTSTSNARLSVGYGGGNYYANGVIYDNYAPIQSNQIIADTIILVECSISNDYSWNIVGMWSYAPINHNHTVSNITDATTVSVVVTYTDNTTETLTLLKQTSS